MSSIFVERTIVSSVANAPHFFLAEHPPSGHDNAVDADAGQPVQPQNVHAHCAAVCAHVRVVEAVKGEEPGRVKGERRPYGDHEPQSAASIDAARAAYAKDTRLVVDGRDGKPVKGHCKQLPEVPGKGQLGSRHDPIHHWHRCVLHMCVYVYIYDGSDTASGVAYSDMYLLHSVLQPPTAVYYQAAGSFTAPGSCELVLCLGSTHLQLFRVSLSSGTAALAPVHAPSLSSLNVHSQIRGLQAVRPPGHSVDWLAITSDSGALVLVQWVGGAGGWERRFAHPFGKGGAGRTVPGGVLRTERAGRAIFVGAWEGCRMVYVLEGRREPEESSDTAEAVAAAGSIKLRSPLELIKPSTAINAACEFLHAPSLSANPRFVAVERRQKPVVAVYEVQLGLNHIARIASVEMDDAYEVMPLSHGHFLVFGDSGHVVYRVGDQKIVQVRRIAAFGLVTCHTTFPADIDDRGGDDSGDGPGKGHQLFAVESGDLFRVAGDFSIRRIGRISPFSTSIALIGSGSLLFAACDGGAHKLYTLSDDGGDGDGDGGGVDLVQEISNLSPLLAAVVCRPKNARKEDTASLFASTGTSGAAVLHHLNNEVPIQCIATSELPDRPERLFRVFSDLYAICFPTRSIFLRVGESVEEDSDSPFSSHAQLPFLYFCELEDGLGAIGVHVDGWVQAGGRVMGAEWRATCPVVAATGNRRQLALSLSDSTLIYFELSSSGSGQMREVTAVKLPSVSHCLAFSPLPPNRQRSRLLVVGGSDDSVIRVLSCDPSDRMAQLALQAATHPPTSLAFTDASHGPLLHVGLKSGVYVRLTVEATSGTITNPHTRYLGSSAITFFPGINSNQLIALCARPWLITSDCAKPLNAGPFFCFAPFATLSIPDALIACSESSFSLLLVQSLPSAFYPAASIAPSTYTIRKLHLNDALGLLVAVGSNGRTASAISVLSPDGCTLVCSLDLPDVVAHCASLLCFGGDQAAWYLVIGVSAAGFDPEDRASSTGNAILTYTFHQSVLTLVHQTESPSTPLVLAPFLGKLLVGTTDALRLYDMGKRRLLRKCESPTPSAIHLLDSQGTRIFAGTTLHSALLYIYRPKECQLQCFADDAFSRPLSSMLVLDYETVMVGDRMGGVSVLRVPNGLTEAMERDPMGIANSARETLFAAPHKLERVCEYSLGDIVTSLHKYTPPVGIRAQCLLYTTVSGSVGCFTPLSHRSTAVLLQELEGQLRALAHPADSLPLCSLTGRHQLLRRSQLTGGAAKGVIDGTFCADAFAALPNQHKLQIAAAVDKDPHEILRIIRDCVVQF